MPADLLRRAATRLRESALAATPGPWGVGNDEVIVRGLEVTGPGSYTCIGSVARVEDESDRDLWSENNPEQYVEVDPIDDANFIALVHPPVALALADWLDLVECWYPAAPRSDEAEHAVAVARAVLREPGGGDPK